MILNKMKGKLAKQKVWPSREIKTRQQQDGVVGRQDRAPMRRRENTVIGIERVGMEQSGTAAKLEQERAGVMDLSRASTAEGRQFVSMCGRGLADYDKELCVYQTQTTDTGQSECRAKAYPALCSSAAACNGLWPERISRAARHTHRTTARLNSHKVRESAVQYASRTLLSVSKREP